MPTIRIVSKRPTVTGWRYLWLKSVLGFNPQHHCAKCLPGRYLNQVGSVMECNTDIELPMADGEVGYLCGVAMPYRWANNLHAAFVVEDGPSFQVKAHNGDVFIVSGARLIPFNDEAARRRFPTLGQAFLTCRNFQFGAHYFP